MIFGQFILSFSVFVWDESYIECFETDIFCYYQTSGSDFLYNYWSARTFYGLSFEVLQRMIKIHWFQNPLLMEELYQHIFTTVVFRRVLRTKEYVVNIVARGAQQKSTFLNRFVTKKSLIVKSLKHSTLKYWNTLHNVTMYLILSRLCIIRESNFYYEYFRP